MSIPVWQILELQRQREAQLKAQQQAKQPKAPALTLEQVLASENERNALSQVLSEKDIFKIKTQYILWGDEPTGATGVVDLEKVMNKDFIKSVKEKFVLMPRGLLWKFFMENVWPTLPGPESNPKFKSELKTSMYGDSHMTKPTETFMWAALVDLFNRANLDYVTKQKIAPWQWEEEKSTAFNLSQDKEALAKFEEANPKLREAALEEPLAQAILKEYLTLPKLGDPGLEINRQFALKELLMKRDYEAAQAVIDAFKYINNTQVGAVLSKPVPFDIMAADGSGVIKATN